MRAYQGLLPPYIRPQLGRLRVADVRHADIERLHRGIAQTAPCRANRVTS